jgi:DnaJ-like protein
MVGIGRSSDSHAASFYDVLQVAPWCDAEVIHAAYRALARRWHPDLNRGPEAEAQMRRLNAAYQVLSDPQRRASYDRDRVREERQMDRRETTDGRARAASTASTWGGDASRAAWAAPPRGGPAFQSARTTGVAAALPRGVRPAAYVAVVMLSAIVTIVIWLAVDALTDGQLNGVRFRASNPDSSLSSQQPTERFPFFAPAGGPGLSEPRERWNR